MKYFLLIVSVLFGLFERIKSQDDFSTGRDLYNSRYDNINIESILDSSRLVTNYVQCLLNRKPCPPEGKDLKRILPEALRSKCAKCSPIQKEHAIKVIRKLYDEYPTYYKELCNKYDPTGEYHNRFMDYIQGEQFNLINSNDQIYTSGIGSSLEPNRDQTQTNYQVINNVIPIDETYNRRTTTTTTTRRPITTTTTFATTTTRRPKTTKRRKTTTTFIVPPTTTIITTTSTLIPKISISTQRPTRSPSQTGNNNNNNVQNNLPSQQLQPQTSTSTNIQSSINIGNRFNDDDASEQMTTRSPFVHPVDLINTFFIPPTYEPQQNRPLVGLINTIGNKISTIAGMLRTTVHVIVGN